MICFRAEFSALFLFEKLINLYCKMLTKSQKKGTIKFDWNDCDE